MSAICRLDLPGWLRANRILDRARERSYGGACGALVLFVGRLGDNPQARRVSE